MIGALTVCLLVSAQSAPAQVQAKNVHFEGLLKLYKSYGLPLPPAGSVPVAVPTSGYVSGGVLYTLAVRTPLKDGKATYYYGAQEVVSGAKKGEHVLGDAAGLPPYVSMASTWTFEAGGVPGPFKEDAGIAIIVQAFALGYPSLCNQIIERGILGSGAGAGAGGPRDPYRLPNDASVEQRVDYLALHHNVNRWVSGEGDRREIALVIQKALGSNMIEKSEWLEKELAGFWESLKPSTARPASVEWKVDQLVDAHGSLNGYWKDDEEPSRLLKELGFEDLPILAEYVDDVRWTRTYVPGTFYTGASVVRLGYLVQQVVARITGRHAGTGGRNSTKEAILAYCVAAPAGDLVGYWKALLEPVGMQVGGVKPLRDFDYGASEKFSQFFPKEFLAYYLEAVQTRSDRDTWGMSFVIMRMPLETQEKIELFEQATTSPWPLHKRTALRRLADLKAPSIAEILKKTYDAFPGGKLTVGQEDLLWQSSGLATISRDEAMWESLDALYRRSQPLAKAIIARIVTMPFSDEARANTDLSLRFLARYVDETATLTESEAKKLSGPRFELNPWLTLGDFIVLETGTLYYDRDGGWMYGRGRADWCDEWVKVTLDQVAQIRADVMKRLRADGYLKG